eukprot:Plantae.Rhodophyta-Purpureofilum_apyrenoidigerum.ctg3407.p1 GENE.Plantae.Rhodophyta-Purpureofilum_apyrenoidigerum.ctg3407~~Plantae.Rhodophyta-Purpureofilum_apyrenoidigerum.ctg3407.p1  ORF type:complete len:413 (-),score=35.66 Plantae.Rhodophyta-Purpureofilum_apyrenoidigerum.ctg3407:153-1391(-)
MCRESGYSVREAMGAMPLRLKKKRSPTVFSKTYFSETEINTLCSYKNKGSDKSITYRYVLSPIYDKILPWLPIWLAPNLVTLLGLFCVLISHFIAMYYMPTLKEDAPRWVYIMLWIGLTSYMALDNLDGRQARRTGSSSPLGHLFDHGCDTLNVFISGLSTAATLQLGTTIWAVLLVWFAGMTIFFGATLEEYFNGALNLGYINGPNEGLLIIEGIFLASGILGPSMWRVPFHLGGHEFYLGQLFVFLMVPLGVPTLLINYSSICREAIRTKRPLKIFHALQSSTPFVTFSCCLFIWHRTSTAFERHPCLFFWCTGLNFFYIISRLIVAHLTESAYPMFFPMSLPMIFGALNAILGTSFGRNTGFVDQYIVLWVLLGVNLIVDVRRVRCMTMQLCQHLGIKCFRISSARKST